jgi:hypothetical protein
MMGFVTFIDILSSICHFYYCQLLMFNFCGGSLLPSAPGCMGADAQGIQRPYPDKTAAGHTGRPIEQLVAASAYPQSIFILLAVCQRHT